MVRVPENGVVSRSEYSPQTWDELILRNQPNRRFLLTDRSSSVEEGGAVGQARAEWGVELHVEAEAKAEL